MKLTAQQSNQIMVFLNSDISFQTKLTILFPLIDELSKHLYKNKKNKERMVCFFNDHLNFDHCIFMGNSIRSSDGNVTLLANNHSLGEIVYELRCYLLHEANCGFEIRFEDGILFGSEEDMIGKIYYILATDLPDRLFRVFINNNEIQNKDNSLFLNSITNYQFNDSYKRYFQMLWMDHQQAAVS